MPPSNVQKSKHKIKNYYNPLQGPQIDLQINKQTRKTIKKLQRVIEQVLSHPSRQRFECISKIIFQLIALVEEDFIIFNPQYTFRVQIGHDFFEHNEVVQFLDDYIYEEPECICNQVELLNALDKQANSD